MTRYLSIAFNNHKNRWESDAYSHLSFLSNISEENRARVNQHMNFIRWSEQYSVNIKDIDEQHRHLIKIINKMHEVVVSGTEQQEIERIIEELFEYTNYHFKTEEKLLETYGYPEQVSHKKEHDTLLKQLLKLKVRLIKGSATVSLETFAFLNNWLVNHILASDKKYSPYLNSKGIF